MTSCAVFRPSHPSTPFQVQCRRQDGCSEPQHREKARGQNSRVGAGAADPRKASTGAPVREQRHPHASVPIHRVFHIIYDFFPWIADPWRLFDFSFWRNCRIAKRRIQQPALDASIPNDKLLITIESANDLPVPGGKGATYVKVVLGFPKDSPTEQRTPLSPELKPKAADDASPAFKSILQFELKRTKELLRYAERRRVKLSVEAHCETKVLTLPASFRLLHCRRDLMMLT